MLTEAVGAFRGEREGPFVTYFFLAARFSAMAAWAAARRATGTR